MSDESEDVGGLAAERLKSFVERIERLEEDKYNISEDIKEVYAESVVGAERCFRQGQLRVVQIRAG